MLSTVKKPIATVLSGAAIAATIGAPAASAMPIDPAGAPGQPGTTQITAPTPRSTAPATVTTPDAGFDLSSAAVGAAAGAGLLIVVLAAGGLAWRRPITRGHGPASA
jgi:hypothetical protein